MVREVAGVPEGQRIQFEEDIAHGLDRTRKNFCGTCPWCGGEFAGGFSVPTREEPEPRFWVRHTSPTCKRFQSSAFEFLAECQRQGARFMPLHERYGDGRVIVPRSP